MRLLIISALLLAPALASADDTAGKGTTSSKTPDATQMASNDCARARKANKPCVLDMGGEEVEGGVQAPTGSAVNVRDYIKFNSLIRVRTDFIVEILKTTEDLD
jgi:hypothetical protein